MLPSLPIGVTEAGFKLGRLRELRRSGASPRVLIVGASPTGTCLDPAAMSAQGLTNRVFNACLTGSTVPVLRRWREMWQHEVEPEVALVGAQPLMFIPSGRYSNAVKRDLSALEANYLRPPPRHPSAMWRWRRELLGAFARPGEGRESVNRAADGRELSLLQRYRGNGFLEAFLDVPLADGLKTLPDDWYESVGFSPHVWPNLEPYLSFVDELRADGIHPIAVIPPLRLSASASTAAGVEVGRRSGAQLLAVAGERALDVIDLRPLADNDEDFADVFHLNRSASLRVSGACGEALARLVPTLRE